MIVREATMEDLQDVYDLVVELAVYEKEPEAVSSKLVDYEEAFSKKKIHILVADDGGVIKGMVLYYWTFSTWRGPMMYLEDFVVSERFRGQGIGQLLFDAFLQSSSDHKVVMTKWQVLDWNEPAIRFYQKNKAIIEKNWLNAKIIFEN